MNTLTLAVPQLPLIENGLRGNMDRVAAMAQRMAAETPASLLLFPELCIEGNDFAAYSRTLEGDALQGIDDFWRALAGRLGRHILAGRVRRQGELLYDSAVCYGPDGRELAVYDKAHLYDGERRVFIPGARRVTLKLGGMRLGLLICADVGFPEMTRAMARDGVDAFVAVSQWAKPYADLWQLCARARAAENACWLVGCNRLGPEPSGRDNCGYSLAVAPDGQVVRCLGDRPDGYFTVDIDSAAVAARRREIQWLEWLRPELYGDQP